MPTALITGANRGIGLEWVRQYANQGWQVVATCRRPAWAHELQALARAHSQVYLYPVDIREPEDIAGLHAELRDLPVDVLINNAGIFVEKGAPGLGSLRYDDWALTFEVNTMGQVRMAEAFAANVARSERKLILMTSTHMASIADITSPGNYYYRSSKAALNAAAKGLAVELEPQGVGVLIIHPGAVKTRMGGPESRITPEESVRDMRRLVANFTLADSGRFFKHDGTAEPW